MDSQAPLPKVQSDRNDAELEPVVRQAALGGLTAEVVHALNNGLFGVLANLELLLADTEPRSESADRLRLVQETARELAATVSALAALARDETPEAALDELTCSTIALLQRTGPQRTLEARYPSEPLPVAADAAAVRHLVVHVLLQAATAAGPTGVLELEVAAEDERAVLRARGAGGDGRAVSELLLVAARSLAHRIGGSLTLETDSALRLELPRG